MDFTLKERSTQTSVSFGFAIPGVFEFGFNFQNSKYSKSVQKIRRASGKVRCNFVFTYIYIFLTPCDRFFATDPLDWHVTDFSADEQLRQSQSRTGVGSVYHKSRRFGASPRVPAAPAFPASGLCIRGVQADLQGLRHALYHGGYAGRSIRAHDHSEQGETGDDR